ncbi:hypothetical protein EGJ09_23345 [Pseudomonas sp. p106]|nr:hypothetical protein EGJ09_23345 [Pseudomonas sp. p106]
MYCQQYRESANRPRQAQTTSFRSITPSLVLPLATRGLRLPPPAKECRLALEEFWCRCPGVGDTRIAQMHIFS